MCPKFWSLSPSASRGLKAASSTGLRKKGTPNLTCFPKAAASCWWNLVRMTRGEANALASETDRPAEAGRPIRPTCASTPKRSARRLEYSRVGPRAAAAAPGAPPEWEGWDDAAVAPEKLGGYLRDIRKLLDEYNYHAAFYGHFGHGCIHMRVSFDLAKREGHSQLRRIRRARRRSRGQLRRLAFGRAWRRTIARSAASENVRAGTDEGVRRIQGRLGPGQQDESAQSGRTPICPPKICGWERTTSRYKPTTHFQVPGRRRLVREGHRALHRAGDCRKTTADRCAPATW